MDMVGHDVLVLNLEDVLFVAGMETDSVLGKVIQSCDEAGGSTPLL